MLARPGDKEILRRHSLMGAMQLITHLGRRLHYEISQNRFRVPHPVGGLKIMSGLTQIKLLFLPSHHTHANGDGWQLAKWQAKPGARQLVVLARVGGPPRTKWAVNFIGMNLFGLICMVVTTAQQESFVLLLAHGS
jgi:hypothetical protein